MRRPPRASEDVCDGNMPGEEKGPFAPEILYVFFRERRGVRRQQDMTPDGVLSIRAQLKHCTEA
jgi:hypothetical protein